MLAPVSSPAPPSPGRLPVADPESRRPESCDPENPHWDLAALRARVRALERGTACARAGNGTAPLGLAALDAHLPGGGLSAHRTRCLHSVGGVAGLRMFIMFNCLIAIGTQRVMPNCNLELAFPERQDLLAQPGLEAATGGALQIREHDEFVPRVRVADG